MSSPELPIIQNVGWVKRSETKLPPAKPGFCEKAG
ncbi:hypothetical protein SPLC1_S532880 [Arthrospira platensis C1]|nr:hypothetical protein SPLC1_S532880 [Arthrospira platensis C1]